MKKFVLGVCLLVSLVVVPGAEAAFAGPVDFGTATAPVPETVTWSNTGGGSVTINRVDLDGSRSNGPFSFTGTSCAGQSGSLAGCSQQIVFDPTTVPPGTYDATFNLTYYQGRRHRDRFGWSDRGGGRLAAHQRGQPEQ